MSEDGSPGRSQPDGDERLGYDSDGDREQVWIRRMKQYIEKSGLPSGCASIGPPRLRTAADRFTAVGSGPSQPASVLA